MKFAIQVLVGGVCFEARCMDLADAVGMALLLFHNKEVSRIAIWEIKEKNSAIVREFRRDA